jgi:hypothetical protein
MLHDMVLHIIYFGYRHFKLADLISFEKALVFDDKLDVGFLHRCFFLSLGINKDVLINLKLSFLGHIVLGLSGFGLAETRYFDHGVTSVLSYEMHILHVLDMDMN